LVIRKRITIFTKPFEASGFFTTNSVRFLTMTKFECTSKVQKIRHYKTDDDVCKVIGISKPTLYVRLKENNWKTSEIFLIESIKL